MKPDPHPVADVSQEAIRERAYEISQRADAGTPAENWERAQRELREQKTGGRAPMTADHDADVSPFPPFTSATTHP